MLKTSLGRLSTRLILIVVGIQAIIVSALIWNSMRLISSGSVQMFEKSVQSQSHLISNLLAPGLAMNDHATLEESIALVTEKQNFVYISVFDSEGKFMAGRHEEKHLFQHDSKFSDITDHVYDIQLPIELAGQLLGSLHIGFDVIPVEAYIDQGGNQNIAIAVAGMCVSVIFTYLLSFLVTGNLRHLESATKALKQGDFKHRININSGDEIGDLADAVDQLAEHLEITTDALHREHDALQRESRFINSLVDNINAVIMEVKSSNFRFTYVSQEAEKLLGFTPEQWMQPGFFTSRLDDRDKTTTLELIKNKLENKKENFCLDFRMKHVNGKSIWVRCVINAEFDDSGSSTLRGLILDYSEQKSAEERILYLAEHDSLTNLINRRRFQEELDKRIAYALRYHEQGALLFIDLDQFKYINDSYGHQYGDEFLVDISRRLHLGLRKTDILGRLGGDEFGIIIPHTDSEQAQQVAQGLLETLREQTYNFNGTIHHASASIGIVMFPQQGHVTNDLLAKADAAMYSAKNEGRAKYHLFNEADNELWNMQNKIHWEDRIRWALENDRFVLHFQPVARLSDMTITHYEVLLRMISQENELIPPGAFLDTAERFGLISEIDRWVLKNAIRAQAQEKAQGRHVSLAINISGRHFGSDDIYTLVNEYIEEFGADPSSIIFEVTETEAVENLTNARKFIEMLQKIGCRFALDDFGIGFSSFHYLRNLPVNFVKIDGSFVRNLHINNEDRVFIKAMVDLAKGLNINCIAEFVENAEIVKILHELGVHSGQGYYLARPMPQTLDSDTLSCAMETPLKIVAND